MHRAVRSLVGVLGAVGLVGLVGAGCNNSGGSLLDDPGATALPSLKVNLPPPPSFAEPNIPREYPDGTVSVYGLRKEFHRYSEQKNKYLGQKVKLKAYLLEIYQCPVCPKNQTCKPCSEPHMFVADEANAAKDKAMLVVEHRVFKVKDPKLTLGKQYTFEGMFQQSSPKGFSASDGLVVFYTMVDDTNKPYVGPAQVAELEALKFEAAAKAKGAITPPAPAPK